MKNIDRKIIVTNENGDQIEGEILFTFEENGDNFILYQVNNNTFASKIDKEGELKLVEEDEWKLIEKIYEDYQESFNEGNE